MQTYYKLAFQTLKNLSELHIISEVEKTQMKQFLLSQPTVPEVEITQDQMSIFILQRIKKMRQLQSKKENRSDPLLLIEEETDEDDHF